MLVPGVNVPEGKGPIEVNAEGKGEFGGVVVCGVDVEVNDAEGEFVGKLEDEVGAAVEELLGDKTGEVVGLREADGVSGELAGVKGKFEGDEKDEGKTGLVGDNVV